MNEIAEQILLHLYNSIEYGFSYRAKKGLFIPNRLPIFWKPTYKKDIKEIIRDLNREKFLKKKQNYDGSITVYITEKGKLRALSLRFKKLKDKKAIWDKKWRMVAFDIPEEFKKGRNALRYRLRMAGFCELQESLFLHPHDCKKEIDDFVKIFKLEKYVRFALLDFIDNQDWLKKLYKLD
jgi:DNA-binding transcriptional regulator PaaX